MELWRPIAEAPDYAVSSFGRVKRVVADSMGRGAGKILSTPVNDKGYRHLNLHIGRRQYLRRVHILVCDAFHGVRSTDKHQVRHLDGDKLNNTPVNLCWGTALENNLDTLRLRDGPSPLKGKAKKLALGPHDIAVIQRASYRAVRRVYPISTGLIAQIKRGQAYGDAA